MKLLKLQIENVKKIRAGVFDFTDGHLTQIKGTNRAGKSTVLDSIIYLLIGKNAIPNGVVTDGEDTAVIRGVVDQYQIKRIIKSDGKTTLKVTSTSGFTINSPQKFLDSISAKFLDPTELVNLSGKECRSKVMQFLGVDTSQIDAETKALETTRTEIGRWGRAIGEITPVDMVEKVNVVELYHDLEEIRDFNKSQEVKEHNIAQTNERIKTLEEQLMELKTTLEKLPQPEAQKSTTELEERIKTADETNREADKYAEFVRKSEAQKIERQRYQDLTDKINDKRKEKSDMLMGAMEGIENLEITDDSVIVDGHTWECLSASEAIEVATKLCMKITPENGIKTLFIKRGESVLSEAKERILKLAEENDFQIIMEVATEQKPTDEANTFYLVEGEIYED